MKTFVKTVLIAFLGGVIALGSYELFFENNDNNSVELPYSSDIQRQIPSVLISNEHGNSGGGVVTDFTKAAKKAVKSVVHVRNVKVTKPPISISQYFRGIRPGKRVRGSGSGVIITPDGYIVTNYHVIKGANQIQVILHDKRHYMAKVVGTAPQADIALLKIDVQNLPYLAFGNSNNVKIGQWVLAVGNPYNLISTVTAGIISAKGRGLRMGTGGPEAFLQTDAAINPGNSGGALINRKGQLIGINTAISSRTGSYIGYGFAIPSNYVRKIVQDLLQYGNVRHVILGVMGSTLDPQWARKHDLPVSQGVYVHSASQGAKKAGLQKGDIIIGIDGNKVKNMTSLSSYVATDRPNDVVQVNFLRNGHEKIVHVRLQRYETYALRQVGVEVTNADKAYLQKFHADHGVKIVAGLDPRARIPVDKFIIVAINGKPVFNVGDVRKIMKNESPRAKTRVVFMDLHGNRERYVF